MSTAARLEPFTVNVRIKMSALWASMLFVFAYVDIFSLYRADVRADIEAGKIAGFTINQSFLLGTTLFILIPSLMVFLAIALRPRVSRTANIAVASLYALMVVGATIGESGYYYILGSAVEVALLGAIVYYAWTWPKERRTLSRPHKESTGSDVSPATTTIKRALMTAQGAAAWRS